MINSLDPNLQVFDGRTFYFIGSRNFDERSTPLELWEWYADPFSYALAYLDEGKLVIDDHSWTGGHAPLPLEARVWFEEVARNALIAQQ